MSRPGTELGCGSCGTPLSATARFCPRCGSERTRDAPRTDGSERQPSGSCPACGAEVSPRARFCPSCGRDLTAARTTAGLPPVAKETEPAAQGTTRAAAGGAALAAGGAPSGASQAQQAPSPAIPALPPAPPTLADTSPQLSPTIADTARPQPPPVAVPPAAVVPGAPRARTPSRIILAISLGAVLVAAAAFGLARVTGGKSTPSTPGPATSPGTPGPAWASGSWTAETSPNPAPEDELYSVSCASVSVCVAVGVWSSNGFFSSDFKSGSIQPLVEVDTGGAWRVVPTPTSTDLGSVSCVSASQCVAVGDRAVGNGDDRTLVEQYTGGGWAEVPSPAVSGAGDSVLNGVSCVSASDCVAVGQWDNGTGGGQHTLVEQYAGGGWAEVSSPDANGATDSVLEDVSCTGTVCVAVGYWDAGSSGALDPLLEEDTAGAWMQVESPVLTGADLNGVSCVSVSRCIVVGEKANHPFVLQGSGTSWTEVPVATSGGGAPGSLDSVSCATPSECIAVGFTGTSAHGPPLVEQETGSGWTEVAGAPAEDGNLVSVDCVAASGCIAVGDTSSWHTLVERRS